VTCARGEVDNLPDLLTRGCAEKRKMKDLGKEYEIEIVAAHAVPAPHEVEQDTTKDAKSLWIRCDEQDFIWAPGEGEPSWSAAEM